MPADYPFPFRVLPDGRKLAFEHRVVMERVLGRYLTVDEVVHHRDGDPSNCSPDNLEVYSTQADHLRIAHGRGRIMEPSLALPFTADNLPAG